jgi:hypothetical protein
MEEWFYAGVAGIRPNQFTVTIQPEPVGDLTWASAKYESTRGPIECRWERGPQGFHMTVRIPRGMTGDVTVPAENATVSPEKGRIGWQRLGRPHQVQRPVGYL